MYFIAYWRCASHWAELGTLEDVVYLEDLLHHFGVGVVFLVEDVAGRLCKGLVFYLQTGLFPSEDREGLVRLELVGLILGGDREKEAVR